MFIYELGLVIDFCCIAFIFACFLSKAHNSISTLAKKSTKFIVLVYLVRWTVGRLGWSRWFLVFAFLCCWISRLSQDCHCLISRCNNTFKLLIVQGGSKVSLCTTWRCYFNLFSTYPRPAFTSSSFHFLKIWSSTINSSVRLKLCFLCVRIIDIRLILD